MLIGLARTSTFDQVAGLEAQKRDLLAAGVEKLFCEQTSSVGDRPQLDAAIEFARQGDTLVVTELSRLARSMADFVGIQKRLAEKRVELRVLGLGLDTSTSTGQLILNVLASVFQFERQIMLERQREGVKKAQLAGKFKGRAPTARAKADAVKQLAASGLPKSKIAHQLSISERSVFRILSENG